MRVIAVILVSIVMSAGQVLAVDRNGEFYSRGLGVASCQIYLDHKVGKTKRYLYYRSWLNGYLTAYNQLSDDTYDVAPGISIERLAEEMAQICAANRDRPFWAAMIALTKSLEPQRQTMKPQLQTVSGGGRSMTIDRELLRSVQAALKARGYPVGVVDGLYGRNTRRALEAFQADQQLSVTGLPDQETQAKLQQ